MKIILSEAQFKRLSEDVGEKYAEKKFGIKPEFADFEDKFKKYSLEKEEEDIIFKSDEITIIKNPKNLANINPSVRGIIDKNGNLYTEMTPKVIHKTIIAIVESVLNRKLNPSTNWVVKPPEDFITVQRDKNTNTYKIGESNYTMRPPEARKHAIGKKYSWDQVPNKEEVEPIFNEFLNKAKNKNPKINFSNEIISTWEQI